MLGRARSALARLPAPPGDRWRVLWRMAAGSVRPRVPGLQLAQATIDDIGTRMVADLRTPFGLSVYRYGFPEPEAGLVRSLLRPGDVFVDGGAHLGVYSLVAAAAVGPEGRVVAVEPVPENVRQLRWNVALNGFNCVEIHQVALGERPGLGGFYSFGAGSAFGSFAPATRSGSRLVTVEVVTLDALVERDLHRVRLVKLDLEGAELRALGGATGLLGAGVDFLVELEPTHLERQGGSVAGIEKVFTRAGYRAFEIRGSAADVALSPVERWDRPGGRNPNLLLSTRSDPLA